MKRQMFGSPVPFLVFATIALLAIPTATASVHKQAALRGIIAGQILLSPVCPVERIPPDPACAPRPYKTTVNILKVGSSAVYKNVSSNTLGRFTVSLPAGSYVLHATSGKIYPRCSDATAKVLTRKTVKIAISCDTGIR